MSEAESKPAVPKPRLRWFQFSVRTLLVVVTFAAIPCSWLAVRMEQARQKRQAAAEIDRVASASVSTIRASLAAQSTGG